MVTVSVPNFSFCLRILLIEMSINRAYDSKNYSKAFRGEWQVFLWMRFFGVCDVIFRQPSFGVELVYRTDRKAINRQKIFNGGK
jgi:hypothetical protein